MLSIITKDKKTIQKNIFEIFRITDKIKELLNKKNIFEPYKYAFFQYKYKQFALMFMLADENMKEDFYREMQDRLRKYNSENLNPQITERLQHIGMFKNILKLNLKNFTKIITEKLITKYQSFRQTKKSLSMYPCRDIN